MGDRATAHVQFIRPGGFPATRSHGELQLRTDATIAVAAEQGFPFNLAVGTIFRGWARAMSGQSAEGVALLRDGLAAYRATGAAVFVPFFLTLLAEALGETGRLDQGLQYLGEAGRLMAETEERGPTPSCIGPGANCWAPLKIPPRPNIVLAMPLRLRDSKDEVLGGARGCEHGAAVARSREAG